MMKSLTSKYAREMRILNELSTTQHIYIFMYNRRSGNGGGDPMRYIEKREKNGHFFWNNSKRSNKYYSSIRSFSREYSRNQQFLCIDKFECDRSMLKLLLWLWCCFSSLHHSIYIFMNNIINFGTFSRCAAQWTQIFWSLLFFFLLFSVYSSVCHENFNDHQSNHHVSRVTYLYV